MLNPSALPPQVRFVNEAFRKLRPGVPLRALHGNMKQGKRVGVFNEFCEAKGMVLFATDIAARGLDFPTVDWVVQADCPEDVAAYIHRCACRAVAVYIQRCVLGNSLAACCLLPCLLRCTVIK